MPHLVLLETSGNQNYLFSTNRLRQIIGASELTYQAGTRLVLEAVKEVGGPDLWNDDPKTLRENILKHKSANDIEIIVATSGKALLRVPDHETGQEIIAYVTRAALWQMPGLDLCGAISEDFAWEGGGISDHIKAVHKLLEEVRAARAHPSARFPALPLLATCADSGLPANTWYGGSAMASTSIAKRRAARDWGRRVEKIDHRLAEYLGDLVNEDDSDETDQDDSSDEPWLAVVHADGNGLGQIFLNFQDHCNDRHNNSAYAEQLRRFSITLDEATEKAFKSALAVFPEKKNTDAKSSKKDYKQIPVFPLVLGGDDLTLICDGYYALNFTKHFLEHFEKETARGDLCGGIIPQVVGHKLRLKRLSACAGIAVIKPHFPFHSAYTLAEKLIESAKIVKHKEVYSNGEELRVSALDFHVLYDASFTDLKTVRGRLDVDTARLTAKPYVVTVLGTLDDTKHKTWIENHHIDGLEKRIKAIRARDEDNRQLLPNNQLHQIREGLFQGRGQADHRLQLIYDRYKTDGLNLLLEDEDNRSLFREVVDRDDDDSLTCETRFLDALESAEFWKGGKQ